MLIEGNWSVLIMVQVHWYSKERDKEEEVDTNICLFISLFVCSLDICDQGILPNQRSKILHQSKSSRYFKYENVQSQIQKVNKRRVNKWTLE